MADSVLRYIERLNRGVLYFQTVRCYGTRVGLTVIYFTLAKKCSLLDTGDHDTYQCLQALCTISYTEFHANRKINVESLFVFGASVPPPPPQWARVSTFTRFLDRTQRRATVGRTTLDE